MACRRSPEGAFIPLPNLRKKAWDKRLEPPAAKKTAETRTAPAGRVGAAARAAKAAEMKAAAAKKAD